MKVIKVENCTECPYVRYDNSRTGEDSYTITCSKIEGSRYTGRICNEPGIVFNCPLKTLSK